MGLEPFVPAPQEYFQFLIASLKKFRSLENRTARPRAVAKERFACVIYLSHNISFSVENEISSPELSYFFTKKNILPSSKIVRRKSSFPALHNF